MCNLSDESKQFEMTPPSSNLSSLFPTGRAVRNPFGKVYFVVILKGKAMVRIDGKSMLLPERTFLFLPPGHLLLRLSCTQDFLFQYLSFSFDFLSDFPLLLKADISNQVTNAPCLPMSPEDFSLIKMYYHFIYHRYLDAECPSEVIKGMLFSLVLEVCRLYSGRNISVEMSRQDKLVDGFFSLLHKYCTQERMAAFYASRLCISDKYLMRSIKKQTGQTFHYWMADFILREAKLMLRSTDLSVTEIADKLSFPNSSSFARFFRKYTGFSPVQFRNEA